MTVLLQVNSICKRYGPVSILEDASASFSSNQKIGVIGRNGAGKSTLCRIITGEEEADSGTISKNSELKLSYLEQHDPYKLDENVIDFLTRYTGREEWECGEMAAKFQILYDQLYQPLSAMAGGYRTRVKLAAMLLRDPNFLILDEPTNYLDLSTLILLENFLQNFNGGFLIVSHDREFLKKTCDHTLEIDQGGTTLYPGTVEEYFEFKEEQVRQKMAYNRTVEKKKEQLQSFVDRFRAKASKATQAKSKMKQLAKLDTIEIAHTASTVKIKIPSVERKGGVALTCDDLAIGYPDKQVASQINMEIERGAKVAVLGDNGQGKTTFLRTIANDLLRKGGNYQWGAGLKLAYYAQHVFSSLHPEDDVYTHLQREAATGVTHQDVLDMAGSFLFQGDDVKKKVSVLSGGERARLILAGLLLSKHQVLMLDEPTNHLDFETVEALALALKNFEGTVLFISHDRTFVNLIATNIVDVKNGRVKQYPGTYEDYVYFLESQAKQGWQSGDGPAEPKRPRPEPKKKEASEEVMEESEENEPQAVLDPAEEKKRKSEVSKLQKKVEKSKKRLVHWEREKKRLLKQKEENPLHYSSDRELEIRELTINIEKEEYNLKRNQNKLKRLKK